MPNNSFKCCIEKAFAPIQITTDTTLESLLSAVEPCKPYDTDYVKNSSANNSFEYLFHVFGHYQNPNVNDKEKICTDYYCLQPTTNHFKGYISVLMIFLIFIIAGNMFVILTARKFRKNVTNLYVISLAVSDLLASCIQIPILIIFALHNGYFCQGIHVCKLYQVVETTFFAASFIQLLIISIDRFLAVFYPYKYRTHVTSNRAKKIICLVWLNAVAWGVLKDYDFGAYKFGTVKIEEIQCKQTKDIHTQIFFGIVFFVPVVIMSVLYFKIWLVAVAQAKELNQRKIQIEYCQEYERTGQEQQIQQQHHKPGFFHRRRLEIRATRVVLTILGTYIVCWSPNLTTSFINTFTDVNHYNIVIYIFLYQIPPCLSSMLNPFIYCILHKDFRRSFKLTLKRVNAKVQFRISFLKRKHKRARERKITSNSISIESYL